MVTFKECRELFLALTDVLAPRLRETPAPVEPTRRASADWSNIRNSPVMWQGAKAAALFMFDA